MENQSFVTEFVLPGLSQNPSVHKILFIAFMIIYIATLGSNLLIVAIITCSPALLGFLGFSVTLCWGGGDCHHFHVLWLLCVHLQTHALLICHELETLWHSNLGGQGRGLSTSHYKYSLHFLTALLWPQCHLPIHVWLLPITGTCLKWRPYFWPFGGQQQWVYLHPNLLLASCFLWGHLTVYENP